MGNNTMTLAELKKIINDKYLHHGDFTLSSGAPSKLYFDMKGLFGNLHDTQVLCESVWWSFRANPVNHFESFGGIELGGAILAAHLMHSHPRNFEVCFIRKSSTPRIHGLKKMIEGAPRSPILLVDDVITSGKTLVDAYYECACVGHVVAGVLCVINRWGIDEIVFAPPKPTQEGVVMAGDIRLKIHSLFKEEDFA